MRRIVMLVSLFVLSITPVIAQSDETEAWSIIERYVGEPVAPPDDWSFEGIIFLQQYYIGNGINTPIGIYGLSISQRTPYLISPSQVGMGTGNFVYSGAFSPDGSWFAVPSGTVNQALPTENSYEIGGIHVYGTDENVTEYVVEWEGWYSGTDASVVPRIQWNSFETFVYNEETPESIYEINPFTGEVIPYNEPYALEFPLPMQIDRITYRYQNRDRQGFIYYEGGYLKLYNRALLAFNSESEDAEYPQYNNYWLADWTQDSSQFYIVAFEHLYIGDEASKILYDTCLSVDSSAWSPSGELAVSDGERISIINFEDSTHYIAAYHEGLVFDWRVPPEED